MAIASDILIDFTNKRIYQAHAYDYTVDTAYTTQALYSYLMDVFDALSYMGYTVPMSAQTPNAFTMINGWFIDDETVKWFKAGAISTLNYTHPTNTTGIRTLTLNGVAGLSSASIGKTVSGVTTGNSGVLLAYDTTRKVLWIRCKAATDTFANASEAINVDDVFCGNMTAISASGENLYVNLYTLGVLTSSNDTIYIVQNGTKLTSWWAKGITGLDVLVKVKEMGTTIDNGNVNVFCRYYPVAGNAALYDNFPITLTAGRQAAPLSTGLDLNNLSSQDAIQRCINGASYAITINFSGPYSRNLNNGNGAKNYDAEIDCNGASLATTYEVCKYVTREGSATSLNSIAGEQYISANVSSYTAIKTSPLGTYAGGKFFGARGIYVKNYAFSDINNFQLIASDGSTQTPPNTITCQVTGIDAGDHVSMFLLDAPAGNIKKDSYILNGAHANTSSTVTVLGSITGGWGTQSPPAAGYLRVVNSGDASETLTSYTSWSGNVFSLTSTLGGNCTNLSDVYIPIIDNVASITTISNSFIQSATLNIKTRVRKYASGAGNSIVPFEIDGTVGSTGITVSAIRDIDGVTT